MNKFCSDNFENAWEVMREIPYNDMKQFNGLISFNFSTDKNKMTIKKV